MSLTFMYANAKKTRPNLSVNIYTDVQYLDRILSPCTSNEICVFWFVGKYDLTQESLTSLCSNKQKLLKTLLQKGTQTYLVDLMAWNAFDESVDPRVCQSQFSALFESLAIGYYSSNRFFQALFELDEAPVIRWMEELFAREPLYRISKDMEASERMIADLYPDPLPKALQGNALQPLSLPKLYSVFQYVEIFFLIEAIIQDQMALNVDQGSQGLELSLKFVLPNDEYKYYLNAPEDKDACDAIFQQDLLNFLNLRRLSDSVRSLEVSIQCFNYNMKKNPKARPYNAGTVLTSPEACKPLIECIAGSTFDFANNRYKR